MAGGKWVVRKREKAVYHLVATGLRITLLLKSRLMLNFERYGRFFKLNLTPNCFSCNGV